MNTHRILFVSFSAMIASLLLAVLLLAGRDAVKAQGPTPPAADSSPSIGTPLPPFADGQFPPPANRPAPDQPAGPDSAKAPALSFSYYKAIGTSFQPRKSASTWDYTTNGCMFQNGGTDFRFQAPLILPEGSEIKYVRIYYIDTAATDMTVWLTCYEPGQASLDLVSVLSTGSGGYGTTLSNLITQTVDMATYAYVLTWGTSVATSANQICGVRVAYYPPPAVFGRFLPIIRKDP